MLKIISFFGTPWCSDCKRTKAFLGEHRIPYDWINIDDNEEAARVVEKINDGKRKVPTLVFSDDSVLVEPSNAELAEKLGLRTGLGHDFHDVIVIGGGPAGMMTALYCAREALDVVIIEKGAMGGQIGFTERLDNFPGFPEGIEGHELAERLTKQVIRFNAEMLKAVEIKTIRKENDYLVAITTTGEEITAKVIVVATGSMYKTLEIPGEQELIGYKVHFCATCDGPFYKGKEVVLIGGGNSAFEESIFLARFVEKVTIIGRSNKWKATQILQDKVAQEERIEIIPNKTIKEFLVGPKKTLEGIKMVDNETNEEELFKTDGVFVFAGISPNNSLLEGLAEFDDRGFVKTYKTMMTQTVGLFAAGDLRSGSTKQAASAAGEGAAVALMVKAYLQD
ncbi:MAG: FAD-dependent oxidoreductase [Candidatus Kariarchaeaceae archaeon]